MIKWLPYELHTHTNHSDGKQTFEELASNAKKIGLEGIAITDHNTISTFDSLVEVSKKNDLDIIKALEWTTFNGHILLLGIDKYIEWRDVTLNNFNDTLERIRADVKLIGIAHPFSIGGAISTGSYFEFEVNDWNNIDYIEVWSGMLPSVKQMNKMAFNMWTDLLNKGHKIAAVSGRDWHQSSDNDKYIACSYIGLKESENNVLESIKQGRVTVGFGYRIDMTIAINDIVYNIGDSIRNTNTIDEMEITVDIYDSSINCKSEFNNTNLTLKLVSNNGEVDSLNVIGNKVNIKCIISEVIWIRGELYAEVNNELIMIAFTNPIYFE